MMIQTKKTLTRIRLINWHYFIDETISVDGSFLISGDNGSGKSTLLDAIQLVLTTNSRRFNPAANEKSKRDLRGYVRGKTGEEGNGYLRPNKTVISYVALEFYEESRKQYFVIGVRLESPDFDSEIKKRWFKVESSLDTITFIDGDKPVFDKHFAACGKPIPLIYQTSEAQDQFRHRLGHLRKDFFDMIPKSLAFKPMNNIKDFITKFILTEKEIDVAALRENITHLKELQELIGDVSQQIEELDGILSNYSEIVKIQSEIKVIDILLKKADAERLRTEIAEIEEKIRGAKLALATAMEKNADLKATLESEERMLNELKVAMHSNECGRLIENLKSDIRYIESEIRPIADRVDRLKEQTANLERAFQIKPELQGCAAIHEIRAIAKCDGEPEVKHNLVLKIVREIRAAEKKLNEDNARLSLRLREVEAAARQVEKEIEELELGRVPYPSHVTKLKSAIEEELRNRKIESPVHILADLIDEVASPEWQNAIEGYLGVKRFTIITEPMAYKIAKEVYEKHKAQIDTTPLADTIALENDSNAAVAFENTLTDKIILTNRNAKRYLYNLIGDVRCVETTDEFEAYDKAITQDCIAYRDGAVEVIDKEIYRLPYIGKKARQLQLEAKKQEHKALTEEISKIKEAKIKTEKELLYISKCNLETLQETITSPYDLNEKMKARKTKEAELKEAEANPGYIELGIKLGEVESRVNELKEKELINNRQVFNCERDVSDYESSLAAKTAEHAESKSAYQSETKGHHAEAQEAEEKYREHIKTKSPTTIYVNFGPRRQTLVNQGERKTNELITRQAKYKSGEFGTGIELLQAYSEESERLRKYELVKYQDKLEEAKKRCELEFRESFLAKMRENIEKAYEIFKDLNKSLKGVRYGKDAYRFLCRSKKEKQGLVNMITSEFNLGAEALFTQQFESEFRGEMDDLFLKLTQSDIQGESILREYTDYREYLDYDIEINSEDGATQYFSKIYGEKSGGETQTPYYVAIAASFSQIYNYGETIRIIMLDEAFDKMDDERIQSMMQFFKEQGFQIILATPPAKMEIIGEYVDTILVAYREGHQTTIEEYDL